MTGISGEQRQKRSFFRQGFLYINFNCETEMDRRERSMISTRAGVIQHELDEGLE